MDEIPGPHFESDIHDPDSQLHTSPEHHGWHQFFQKGEGKGGGPQKSEQDPTHRGGGPPPPKDDNDEDADKGVDQSPSEATEPVEAQTDQTTPLPTAEELRAAMMSAPEDKPGLKVAQQEEAAPTQPSTTDREAMRIAAEQAAVRQADITPRERPSPPDQAAEPAGEATAAAEPSPTARPTGRRGDDLAEEQGYRNSQEFYRQRQARQQPPTQAEAGQPTAAEEPADTMDHLAPLDAQAAPAPDTGQASAEETTTPPPEDELIPEEILTYWEKRQHGPKPINERDITNRMVSLVGEEQAKNMSPREIVEEAARIAREKNAQITGSPVDQGSAEAEKEATTASPPPEPEVTAASKANQPTSPPAESQAKTENGQDRVFLYPLESKGISKASISHLKGRSHQLEEDLSLLNTYANGDNVERVSRLQNELNQIDSELQRRDAQSKETKKGPAQAAAAEKEAGSEVTGKKADGKESDVGEPPPLDIDQAPPPPIEPPKTPVAGGPEGERPEGKISATDMTKAQAALERWRPDNGVPSKFLSEIKKAAKALGHTEGELKEIERNLDTNKMRSIYREIDEAIKDGKLTASPTISQRAAGLTERFRGEGKAEQQETAEETSKAELGPNQLRALSKALEKFDPNDPSTYPNMSKGLLKGAVTTARKQLGIEATRANRRELLTELKKALNEGKIKERVVQKPTADRGKRDALTQKIQEAQERIRTSRIGPIAEKGGKAFNTATSATRVAEERLKSVSESSENRVARFLAQSGYNFLNKFRWVDKEAGYYFPALVASSGANIFLTLFVPITAWKPLRSFFITSLTASASRGLNHFRTKGIEKVIGGVLAGASDENVKSAGFGSLKEASGFYTKQFDDVYRYKGEGERFESEFSARAREFFGKFGKSEINQNLNSEIAQEAFAEFKTKIDSLDTRFAKANNRLRSVAAGAMAGATYTTLGFGIEELTGIFGKSMEAGKDVAGKIWDSRGYFREPPSPQTVPSTPTGVPEETASPGIPGETATVTPTPTETPAGGPTETPGPTATPDPTREIPLTPPENINVDQQTWDTLIRAYNNMDPSERDEFVKTLSDPQKVREIIYYAKVAQDAAAAEDILSGASQLLENPDYLNSLEITQGDTVSEILARSNYDITWGSSDADILGTHTLANYELLKEMHDQVGTSGIAVEQFPTPQQIINDIKLAEGGDLRALHRLQESLHWVPAGGRFNVLTESGFETIKRRYGLA